MFTLTMADIEAFKTIPNLKQAEILAKSTLPPYEISVSERKVLSEKPRIMRFHELAQCAMQKYYLVPFTKPLDERVGVKRRYHGGVHVSRTALLCSVLVDFYRKYLPEKIELDPALITEKNLDLLMLAAFCHDSANTGESEDDSTMHSQFFEKDMLEAGYAAAEIEPFRLAILHKDAKPFLSFWSKILHDADSLEIMRIKGITFNPTYLHIFSELQNNTAAEQSLLKLIEFHRKLIEHIENSNQNDGVASDKHQFCEKNDNCFLATETMSRTFLLTEMAIAQLVRSGSLLENLNDLSLLDLYLGNCDEPKSNQDNAQMNALQQKILDTYKEEGVLLRLIESSHIEKELESLARNKEVLTKNDIKNNSDMIEYLKRQKSAKKMMPNGFAWRPASLGFDGLPTRFFDGGLGIIIDPQHESFLAPFWFKSNIGSWKAATGELPYFDETGFYKTKQGCSAMRDKLIEINNRRQGILLDQNAHYFGEDHLKRSEALCHYQAAAVLGIVIADTASIYEAFRLQTKLGSPLRPFFSYSEKEGLKPISIVELKHHLMISPLKRHALAIGKKHAIEISVEDPRRIERLAQSNEVARIVSNDYAFDAIKFIINFPRLKPKQVKHFRDFFEKLRPQEKDIALFHGEDWHYNPILLCEKVRNVVLIENESNLKVELYLCANPIQQTGYNAAIRRNNTCIETIFRDFDRFLQNKESLPYFHERKELLEGLDNRMIVGNIHVTFPGTEPSQDCPFGLEFTHPTVESVHCKTEFRDGRPGICFMYNCKKQPGIYFETDKLPEICKQYYALRINDLKTFLETKETNESFAQLGMYHINCEMREKKSYLKNKMELVFTFDTVTSNKDETNRDLAELLYKKLGISNFKVSCVSEANAKIAITIPDIQKIENIIMRLQELSTIQKNSSLVIN